MSHCEISQSISPAARSSIQKFDNDYDVIFMYYTCSITMVAMEKCY